MAKAKKDKTANELLRGALNNVTSPVGRFEARVTRVTVCPVGARLFSERCTRIELTDDVGGEYVKVTQQTDDGAEQTIGIEPDEWPAVRDAITTLLDNVRVYKE